MKRIMLAATFVILSAGIGFAIYYVFFRAPAAPPAVTPAGVNAPVGALPEAAPGAPVPGAPPAVPPALPEVSLIARGGLTAVTPVSAAPTIGAAFGAAGNLNFYNRSDGKFYRMTADGTVASLSNKVFFSVQNATFDPTGSKAVIEYPDGSNISYDFATGAQVTLPKQWESFDFDPQGQKIVAKSMSLDEQSRFLIVANTDGSGARAVQELGANADKVQVAWSPNNQVIATAATGQTFDVDRREVFFIGQNQENFKSMVIEGMDFRPQWAPSGGQLLYSVAGSLTDYKPALWIVDASGDSIGRNRRSLNVNTWADKCAFADNQTLYCAVPDTLRDGAGLQPSTADSTPDTIYKIDLSTGLQTRLAVPQGSPTVEKLMLSPDGSQLYFTEKNTGVLNKIRLN